MAKESSTKQSRDKNDNGKNTPSWVQIVLGLFTLIGVLAVGYWRYSVWFPPPKPEPPTPKIVPYTGRVREVKTEKPIRNAKVSIEQGTNVPQVQPTDSDGIFTVQLPESATSVKVVVEADGYEHFDRNVTVSRSGIEPIFLTPLSKAFGVTVGRNPKLAEVVAKLEQMRGIKVDFSDQNCYRKAQKTVVEFNGGQLTGKDNIDFLESVRSRTNLNFSVNTKREDSSYEIVCQ